MSEPLPSSSFVPSYRRRRLSLERVFFWTYAGVIPLVAVGAGLAMLIASSNLDAQVAAYRSAPACETATTISCYRIVAGTLTNVSISHGKGGDYANMTLQLPSGPQTTWAQVSVSQEDALHSGLPIRVRIYDGNVTSVYLAAIGIETKDSPLYQQNNLREGAVIIPIVGVAVSVTTFLIMRRRSSTKQTIDTALPLEEQARLLRRALDEEHLADGSNVPAPRPPGVQLPLTLRPHPWPTGRPWWMGVLIWAAFLPYLLWRMRTPASIAEVVLIGNGFVLMATVIIRWLYRHIRKLVIDDFAVRRVNLWGGSMVVPRTEITGLACPSVFGMGQPFSERRLLLLDATGRCRVRLARYVSTGDEAAQLAAALRVPIDQRLSRPMSAAELRRLVPGAAGWMEAHPWITSGLLVVPILVAVSLFVWALNGFT